MWREFFPLLAEGAEIGSNVGTKFCLAKFVAFGEDECKGDFVLAKPLDEIEVDALRFVARIDKHKETRHLLAMEHVARYHLLEFFLFLLATFGKAVARKVYQMSAAVDEKVVYHHCLAWRG